MYCKTATCKACVCTNCCLCAEIRCGLPLTVPHTNLLWDGSTKPGSVVRYKCMEEFYPESAVSTCSKTGEWGEVSLICKGRVVITMHGEVGDILEPLTVMKMTEKWWIGPPNISLTSLLIWTFIILYFFSVFTTFILSFQPTVAQFLSLLIQRWFGTTGVWWSTAVWTGITAGQAPTPQYVTTLGSG